MTRKILIVDDESHLREMIGEFLGNAGFDIFEAGDGREGLEQYLRHQPQVIISDLSMPVMGGLELLSRLKLEKELTHSVIILTGFGEDKDIETCFQLGIRSFLRKPVNLYELMGVVRCAFDLIDYSTKLKVEIAEKEKTNNLLRHTFNSMGEGVVSLDQEFRIRFVSEKAARILDQSEECLLGKSVLWAVGAPIAGPKGHLMSCFKEGCGNSDIKTRLFCKSGAIVPISLSITPLGEARPTGWLLVFRDGRDEERLSLEESRIFSFGSLVGCDPMMMELYDLIERLSSSGANVLIQGESGTGKELVAREIHNRGRRAQKPFHPVNCAAIASNLMESEFFGHEKGAFTGAGHNKPGRFELSDKGTLFLDEIVPWVKLSTKSC